MKVHMAHIPQTTSTNDLVVRMAPDDADIFVLTTDFQSSGRGQKDNRWVSGDGENILMSLYVAHPALPARSSFLLSAACALAVADVVGQYTDAVYVKWPNDIYVGDEKICGILIETAIRNGMLNHAILGIGLNVNQSVFPACLPNPISLIHLTGHPLDRSSLTRQIVSSFIERCSMLEHDSDTLLSTYCSRLYRRNGFFPYRDSFGDFEARIDSVTPEGILRLALMDGSVRGYGFKEVEYVLTRL